MLGRDKQVYGWVLTNLTVLLNSKNSRSWRCTRKVKFGIHSCRVLYVPSSENLAFIPVANLSQNRANRLAGSNIPKVSAAMIARTQNPLDALGPKPVQKRRK